MKTAPFGNNASGQPYPGSGSTSRQNDSAEMAATLRARMHGFFGQMREDLAVLAGAVETLCLPAASDHVANDPPRSLVEPARLEPTAVDPAPLEPTAADPAPLDPAPVWPSQMPAEPRHGEVASESDPSSRLTAIKQRLAQQLSQRGDAS